MTEKLVHINELISKKDLELILEVNKKAIEIETEVAEQNEIIVSSLKKCQEEQEEINSKLDEIDSKLEEITKKSEEITKDIFKIQVFFVTGLLSLVIQIIQIFVRK